MTTTLSFALDDVQDDKTYTTRAICGAYEEAVIAGDIEKKMAWRARLLSRYNYLLMSGRRAIGPPGSIMILPTKPCLPQYSELRDNSGTTPVISTKKFRAEGYDPKINNTTLILLSMRWEETLARIGNGKSACDYYVVLVVEKANGDSRDDSRIASSLKTCRAVNVHDVDDVALVLIDMFESLVGDGDEIVLNLVKLWLGPRKLDYNMLMLAACRAGHIDIVNMVKKWSTEYSVRIVQYQYMMWSAIIKENEEMMILIRDWSRAENVSINYESGAWEAVSNARPKSLKVLIQWHNTLPFIKKIASQVIDDMMTSPWLGSQPDEPEKNDKKKDVYETLKRWKRRVEKEAHHAQVMTVAISLHASGLCDWDIARVASWATNGTLTKLEVLRIVNQVRSAMMV